MRIVFEPPAAVAEIVIVPADGSTALTSPPTPRFCQSWRSFSCFDTTSDFFITTTEVADEVVGGVFPAGPTRFEVILERRLPYIMSLGALDMVNFGPLDSVPSVFKGRKLHIHNPSVTLMRTTVQENRACAAWIARKLNAYPESCFTLLIPEGGVSELDKPGNAFYDPEADQALFNELERLVQTGQGRRIVRHPSHINDAAFAEALGREFARLHIH